MVVLKPKSFDIEIIQVVIAGMASDDPIVRSLAEAIIKLTKVCKNAEQFEKAKEYIAKSAWSANDIFEYMSMTGEFPPDSVMHCPSETIETVRYLG